ncbi:hypothetical protein CKM354_001259800 [Cercospora kikuchii]|uniref:Uncharacterized protein n=1 Tax=Cercospora kikuchii TaxID=84275 RepID=A0A9P3FMA5_9PEZI|nr:uncharacterized protein CKM354_001259800 [Cercospora kikuchii]GIZ49568.1 hypothetical protein CKM354_001259800 [Cercospora kikuchii]
MPLPPRAATTSLHTEIQAWVTAMTAGATGIANTSPAALALLAGRFDQLEYYGEKLLAYRRTTPTNPSLTTTVVFNRVDHVAPFTRPLSAFIRPGSGNTRMFDFTLTLTISPCPVGLHLQPTIVVKSKPFPLGRVPTMYAEDLDLGDPARKFAWRRVCLHDADMTPPFLPTGGIKCRLMGFDMVYGDVPVEVFNHESGFCPWEGVSFPAETIHKSAKVTGTVEVVYGYGGVGSERNCAKFEHELAFGRHRGGEWDAYTASIGQTVFNGPFVQKSGSHWKGPTGVIMKANRLYGRSNPKAME